MMSTLGKWLGALFFLAMLANGVFYTATVAAQADDTRGLVSAADQNDAQCGVVLYDWNAPVTQSHQGFPRFTPPVGNGNLVSPINYTGGTLHLRVDFLTSQPVVQNFGLQYCVWQEEGGYNYGREICVHAQRVRGQAGNSYEWSAAWDNIWRKDNQPIEWFRPRFSDGAAIKTTSGAPVSGYPGFNWGGQNPAHWYPFTMHFSVVMVPEDGSFCGWGHYRNPTAVTMDSFSAADTGGGWQIPLMLVAVTALLTTVVFAGPRKLR